MKIENMEKAVKDRWKSKGDFIYQCITNDYQWDCPGSAAVWLYRFLTDLPLSRICCLTTSLTCYIFILHCFNPYINVFLFLLLAQSVIGFVAPDNPRRQRRGRSRGRRCNRRV